MTDQKTEEFIKKAKLVHGDKFDYSKVVYKNNRTPVEIFCKKCDEYFWQSPQHHLNGCGCPSCVGRKRLTTGEFVKRSQKIHENKYIYDKTEYTNSTTKVCITCPIHGDFWQTPKDHLSSKGCPECGKLKCIIPEEVRKNKFIEKAKSVHGNKYDYSFVDYKNNHKKVKIICQEHGVFEQTPGNHLSGHGCPKCACESQHDLQRDSKEDFVKKAQEVHGNKYDYSKVEYVNNSTKVCIICPKHGEFWQTPRGHLLGNGCKKCGYEKNKIGKDEFIRRSREIHGNKYDYSKVDFIDSDTPVCIVCPTHGEFMQTPRKHFSGRGCIKCSHDEMRLTKEEFVEKANKIHNGKYNYSKIEYTNSQTKVCIICPIHGEFTQTPNYHLLGGGCPECFYEKERLSTDEFIERARKIHGDKYDYSNVIYKDSHSKVNIVCPKHGTFMQSYECHVLKESGCPHCHPAYSKAEKEIVEFIKSIYNGEIRENVRDLISPKEVDIYLPELKLAFEYNGLYYHSERYCTSSIAARDKFLNCEKQGVQLVTIYEDEWRDEQETVKSMISHAFGKFERIFARKTEVKKLENPKEYQQFLEENHIQGRGPATSAYGLYYKEELVSVMTFMLPRENMGRNKEKDAGKIELARFCNKKGVSVVGGASKLLKFFLQSEEGKSFSEVYSYSDNRISQGKLYKSIGFELEKEVPVNYFYTNFEVRKRKQGFRKSKFKEKGVDIEGKTEKELAEAEGWYKIYDCGKRLWILKINKNEGD